MLIDTSGFLCLVHKDEAEHLEARALYDSAATYLTHNYILSEFVPLARSRKFPTHEALIFSQGILTDPSIEVIWVDTRLHNSALELLQNRSDKSYSLCDAVSFIVMKERRIADALTTDRHFEQEGFVRLLS